MTERSEYVKVRVFPGAKKEEIERVGERWLIKVKEKSQRGSANKRVAEIVCELYGVPAGKARIVSGHRSPNKIFSVIL